MHRNFGIVWAIVWSIFAIAFGIWLIVSPASYLRSGWYWSWYLWQPNPDSRVQRFVLRVGGVVLISFAALYLYAAFH